MSDEKRSGEATTNLGAAVARAQEAKRRDISGQVEHRATNPVTPREHASPKTDNRSRPVSAKPYRTEAPAPPPIIIDDPLAVVPLKTEVHNRREVVETNKKWDSRIEEAVATLAENVLGLQEMTEAEIQALGDSKVRWELQLNRILCGDDNSTPAILRKAKLTYVMSVLTTLQKMQAEGKIRKGLDKGRDLDNVIIGNQSEPNRGAWRSYDLPSLSHRGFFVTDEEDTKPFMSEMHPADVKRNDSSRGRPRSRDEKEVMMVRYFGQRIFQVRGLSTSEFTRFRAVFEDLVRTASDLFQQKNKAAAAEIKGKGSPEIEALPEGIAGEYFGHCPFEKTEKRTSNEVSCLFVSDGNEVRCVNFSGNDAWLMPVVEKSIAIPVATLLKDEYTLKTTPFVLDEFRHRRYLHRVIRRAMASRQKVLDRVTRRETEVAEMEREYNVRPTATARAVLVNKVEGVAYCCLKTVVTPHYEGNRQVSRTVDEDVAFMIRYKRGDTTLVAFPQRLTKLLGDPAFMRPQPESEEVKEFSRLLDLVRDELRKESVQDAGNSAAPAPKREMTKEEQADYLAWAKGENSQASDDEATVGSVGAPAGK